MKNLEAICFDDVLIAPKFSEIESRKDVNIFSSFSGLKLTLPIISANMDSVTGPKMAAAIATSGGIGCLHRFSNIDENVRQFLNSFTYNTEDYTDHSVIKSKPIVSIGLGKLEIDRAVALIEVGADVICIDVAHGASIQVVNQVKKLRQTNFKGSIIVGNFATGQSIKDFLFHVGSKYNVDAFKVGVGGGSACLTRVVTGCGVPTLASVIDCVSVGVPVIADGGMRNSGDIAKALAAGAEAVMLGGMLAGTDESPGEQMIVNAYDKQKQIITRPVSVSEHLIGNLIGGQFVKIYRGSASQESYEVQGKVAKHRTAEGDSFTVPYKGPVADVLQQIEGGIRSAMSYVGAANLEEFYECAEFIKVTASGTKESGSHGKR